MPGQTRGLIVSRWVLELYHIAQGNETALHKVTLVTECGVCCLLSSFATCKCYYQKTSAFRTWQKGFADSLTVLSISLFAYPSTPRYRPSIRTLRSCALHFNVVTPRSQLCVVIRVHRITTIQQAMRSLDSRCSIADRIPCWFIKTPLQPPQRYKYSPKALSKIC